MGSKDAVANAYKKLYTIYKKTSRPDSALKYNEKNRLLADTLYNIDRAKAINELNIRYETEKKEQKIKQLSIEKKIGRMKQTTYGLVLLFTLIITTLIILHLMNRNRQNKLAMEKVTLQLEMNKKDLDQFTANVIAKNKLIDDLEIKLQHLADNSPTSVERTK
jgi:hypothetical protein